MKLGRGGIRDIEFFTQTHQIIFGGRDKSIRSKATIKSLKLISEKKSLEKDLKNKNIKIQDLSLEELDEIWEKNKYNDKN